MPFPFFYIDHRCLEEVPPSRSLSHTSPPGILSPGVAPSRCVKFFGVINLTLVLTDLCPILSRLLGVSIVLWLQCPLSWDLNLQVASSPHGARLPRVDRWRSHVISPELRPEAPHVNGLPPLGDHRWCARHKGLTTAALIPPPSRCLSPLGSVGRHDRLPLSGAPLLWTSHSSPSRQDLIAGQLVRTSRAHPLGAFICRLPSRASPFPGVSLMLLSIPLSLEPHHLSSTPLYSHLSCPSPSLSSSHTALSTTRAYFYHLATMSSSNRSFAANSPRDSSASCPL